MCKYMYSKTQLICFYYAEDLLHYNIKFIWYISIDDCYCVIYIPQLGGCVLGPISPIS